MAVELLPGMPTEEEIRVLSSEESCRPDFPPWSLGRTYNALMERGYRQAQIAKAVGESQAHVSRCVAVYQGLSPGAHDVLSRLSKSLGLTTIVTIAMMRDENDAPNQSAQLAYIEQLVGEDSFARTKFRFDRFVEVHRLELPSHAAPFVIPLLQYLAGSVDTLAFPPGPPGPEGPPCPPTPTHAVPRRARSRTRSTY